MKICALLLWLFSSCLSVDSGTITGRVVKVADGDTFTLLTDSKQQLRIRLAGIDCPEKKQDFGTRAQQFTSDLIFAKTVTVEKKDTDRYGRIIGVVKLANGRSLNEELLKAGLAWHYKKHDKSSRFAGLERQAKNNRLGIWSRKDAIAPWEFRSAKRKKI
jgi:micrococcal nuclease